jgi:ethanolamine utilization cobalamin adenosyltransferase
MCIFNRFVQPWKPWWGQSSISNTVGSSSGSTSKSLIQEISIRTAAIDNTTTSTDAQQQQQQQQQQQFVTVQHSNAAFDEQIEAAAVEDTVTDDENICEKHTPQALITAATAATAAATSSSISNSVTAASGLIKHVVLDVLCAYAFTLRLYNGCWCCDTIQVHKLPYTAFLQ